MTYKICIPVYLGSAAVDNLLASIDIAWHYLILVDNSPDSYCKKFEGRGAMIYYYPENIGVSRAWNIGLKSGADWVFLLSQAVVFPGGFSEFLLGVDTTNEYCYFTDLGWHCVGISQKTVALIGLFDTNYYPAYLEDTDYYRRMCLAGIEHGQPHTPQAITSTIGSSSGLGKDVRFKPLNDYFFSKWNSTVDEHGWGLPFGDKPLSYFPEKSVKELQNTYGY